MSANKLLTNHLLMLIVILFVFLLPLVLNAVLDLLPIGQPNIISFYLLSVGHMFWLLAVAIQFDALYLRRFGTLILTSVGVAATIVAAILYFDLRSKSVIFTDELVDYASIIYLSVAIGLSALISERISKTSLEGFLNFWGVFQWPIFLFLIAPKLRRSLLNSSSN